jgi:uncharacterized protein involved in exopolysaccharide biosynthesis
MEKIGGILKAILRRKLIVVNFLMTSLFVGIVYGFMLLPTIYEARAKVLVEYPGKVIDFTGRKIDFLDMQAKLVKSRPVAERAATILSSTPESATKSYLTTENAITLLNRVEVKVDKNTDIIEISIKSPNSVEAAKIANAYAHAFEQVSKKVVRNSIAANIAETSALLDSAEKDFKEKEAALARAGNKSARLRLEKDASEKFFDETYERLQYLKNDKERFDVKVRVFDEAQKPRIPVSPNRKRILHVAAIIGICAGCAAAYYIEMKSAAKAA